MLIWQAKRSYVFISLMLLLSHHKIKMCWIVQATFEPVIVFISDTIG